MSKRARVAICQSTLAPGGRLRVILGIVKVLNEAGIVPDILTARLLLKPQELLAKYGQTVNASFLEVFPNSQAIPLLGDFKILLFNAPLRRLVNDYDLLINSSNSLIWLPQHQRIVSYVHFPRKYRVMAAQVDIHQPDISLKPWSPARPQRAVLRLIYRLGRVHDNQVVVCNSEFTRAAVLQVYDLDPPPIVVYPPVTMGEPVRPQDGRESAIVSVGRFSADKRQIEQIQLAERLPDTPFHIFGFANQPEYYERCRRYVEEQSLSHVHLHPDAPYEEMQEQLRTARFFLHATIEEPFGITTIQAIAAGCLPIVHDSGGSRETVPVPELRYRQLDQVSDIITRLEGLDATDRSHLISSLQEHVSSRFDASIFHRRMRDLLLPLLGINKD